MKTLLATALASMACAREIGPAPPTAEPTITHEPAPPAISRVPDAQLAKGLRCELYLAFDQPSETVLAPPEAAYRSKQVYVGAKDYSKLYAQLECRSPGDRFDEQPTGPLGTVTAIYVFATDPTTPLARWKRGELVYTGHETECSFAHDLGEICDRAETIRVFVREPTSRHVRDTRGYRLTFVAVDRDGKTVAIEQVTGDEREYGIEPHR
jgi:hypothetical protein